MAVEGYFAQADKDGHAPKPGYNTTGRGYPDISLAGLRYQVIISSNPTEMLGMSGTSAPCSVAAAFFSNINAARMAIGKKSIGFVNPLLYPSLYYSPDFFNDITVGDNKVNCDKGFYTAEGWDPVTGMGSINYEKFEKTVLGFGTSTPTANPTNGPSFRPTRKPIVARPSYTPLNPLRSLQRSRPRSRLCPRSLPQYFLPTSQQENQ
jgi:hypothetical protein